MDSESTERKATELELKKKIDGLGAEGIHIETMGVIWRRKLRHCWDCINGAEPSLPPPARRGHQLRRGHCRVDELAKVVLFASAAYALQR
jgi:hypothetical protein